jgi:hypothetical protein
MVESVDPLFIRRKPARARTLASTVDAAQSVPLPASLRVGSCKALSEVIEIEQARRGNL